MSKSKVPILDICDLCGPAAGVMHVRYYKGQKLCPDHYIDDGVRRDAYMNKTGKVKYKDDFESAFIALIPLNRR